MTGRILWCAALLLSVLGPGTGSRPQMGAEQVVPLGAPVLSGNNGTMVLRGSLGSTFTLILHGAFSVGHATGLSWDLLRATDMAVNGYHETVVSERFSFNVPPDSAQDLTVDGMPIRRFTWDAPPADTTIKVVVKRTFSVDAGLTRFHSAASYPLASVPDDVKPYLQVTHSLQLTASQRAFVRHLVGKQSRERAVVTKVANWVASSMRYDASLVAGPYDASWVLANRRGTCQGYASVMAGMLRALGIPSQVVYGWVSSRPLTVRSGSNFETISWAQPGTPGAFHDWLNVYFPGKGWVAFDPQREKFFVDTRHYALLTEVDATDPGMGGWTAYPVGDQSITGRTLSFGGTEAVPESGIIPPQVAERDTLRVHIAAVVHDVRAVTLLSR